MCCLCQLPASHTRAPTKQLLYLSHLSPLDCSRFSIKRLLQIRTSAIYLAFDHALTQSSPTQQLQKFCCAIQFAPQQLHSRAKGTSTSVQHLTNNTTPPVVRFLESQHVLHQGKEMLLSQMQQDHREDGYRLRLPVERPMSDSQYTAAPHEEEGGGQ